MSELSRRPPPPFFRWAVLVFVSLAMFGNYYVYDCIAPVADLLSKQLGFSDSNIGLLQAPACWGRSSPSFPAILR
jgi:hypothetical protein